MLRHLRARHVDPELSNLIKQADEQTSRRADGRPAGSDRWAKWPIFRVWFAFRALQMGGGFSGTAAILGGKLVADEVEVTQFNLTSIISAN